MWRTEGLALFVVQGMYQERYQMSFVRRDVVYNTLPQFSSEHSWDSSEYKAEWKHAVRWEQ